MKEITKYIDELKDRYHLKSDYALAHKLGITQPEANHLRRGLKVPKEELCIRMAKLLGKNPVELMLVAQKDRAPQEAKEYWTLARTAVDVMLHVPSHPRYLPKKVEAIGRELRQMEAQCLQYANGAAVTEPVRLMETTQRTVDALMEYWNFWKQGGPLYPNYLLANQEAVRRGVTIRRLLVISAEQAAIPRVLADAIEVMEDQRKSGVQIFFAFREEILKSLTYQRLVQAYKRRGSAAEINAATFDGEIVVMARSYESVPLGLTGPPKLITRISQLEITWKPEVIEELNPAPLFDMTRYVREFAGKNSFMAEWGRFRREYFSGQAARPGNHPAGIAGAPEPREAREIGGSRL
jgi:hypothetical protein